MGSHSKKHKKSRHRSRSRSLSSERRHRKSRRRSRSRSRSSSSDSSRSDRRTKSRKHHRRSQSRSQSRSRSPLDHRRGRRSRSRSRDRDRHSNKHRHRSRSRSLSRSKRRSRTRSRTPSRRRRSRSRSASLERSSHGGSRSRHDSKEKTKEFKEDKQSQNLTPSESVKQKMQKALEAAASANDKLKEKGVISATVKQEPLSLAEEQQKQKAIAEIEEDSFKPSTFLSGQSTARPLPAKLTKEQNHDNAIFGSAAVSVAGLNQASFKRNQTIFYKTVNRGELASSLLAKTSKEKMDAWIAKLAKMREEKIKSNPEYFKKFLTIGTDDSWD
ncbi:serine/arginine-rich splicing factor 4-like [Acanthaster planci]|uniref:Serine/arginine-rich splicing factor 4-like n=1 Tax=Acanthaster planci TaxID=133434 RepID=A0A8B7ZHK0_ACAPL|nr:serine/arginine-rich splicing factor 4-like [Acanthaster planci]